VAQTETAMPSRASLAHLSSQRLGKRESWQVFSRGTRRLLALASCIPLYDSRVGKDVAAQMAVPRWMSWCCGLLSTPVHMGRTRSPFSHSVTISSNRATRPANEWTGRECWPRVTDDGLRVLTRPVRALLLLELGCCALRLTTAACSATGHPASAATLRSGRTFFRTRRAGRSLDIDSRASPPAHRPPAPHLRDGQTPRVCNVYQAGLLAFRGTRFGPGDARRPAHQAVVGVIVMAAPRK
jgi:hypothetical protein